MNSVRDLLLTTASVLLCASAVSAQTGASVGRQVPNAPQARAVDAAAMTLSGVEGSPSGIASPNAATRVAFVQQPLSTPAGTTIVPPITVQLKDFWLRDVAQAGVSVSLTITSGSGTLNGTATRETNEAGLATFDDVSIDLLGSKKLKASSPGLSSATSKSFDITLGPPSRLLVRREPSQTATAGVPFPQQPEVWVVDAGGNLVSSDNSTQLVASRLAGNGELQGTVQVTARRGVVSFANLSHRVAGEITILFTSESLIQDTTTAVEVKPAAAAQLAFVQQPANTTAGAVITPPVTVRVKDAFGNDVGTSGTPVTLALTSGSGTLSGTLTRNSVSGTATFDDLSIDIAGSKQVTASSGSLTSAISDAFTITPKAAKSLAFVQQPSGAEAAAPIAPPVTVQLRDSLGNDVPLTGVSVSLQLASGTGTLGGTTTKVTNDAGIARFSDLSVDRAGQKRLRAASGTLASALSQTFAITAGRETQLAFLQQPTNTIAGQNVSPAVTVQLRDSLGNDVAKAGVSVLVALTAGSSGTLTGATAQLTDASGLASFGNLSVDLAGTKSLAATASGLDLALSSPFTVSPAVPSRLVFTQSPGNATAGIPFSSQPAVALHDRYQNLVTGVAQDVTLAIHANAGHVGTLSGATTVQVDTATGSATFSGLSIDKSGTAYTLTATGSTVSMIPGAVVSNPFSVAPAPASQVRVESDPGGTGTPLGDESVSSGTSVTVYAIARDPFDNFVSNVAGEVWSLLNRTGGVSDADLVPGQDGKSATFTGAAVGSAVINVAVGGLASIPSGTIRVVNNATATRILVETAANGAGNVLVDQILPSGSSLTAYAIARDLNNNFVSNVAADAWSLVNGTGGMSSGDLIPSVDRRSATLIGRSVGAARIRATLGNLAPTTTGIITITPGPPSIVVGTAGTRQSAKVGTTFQTRMAAKVTDAAGNPVGGLAVTFNAPPSGASGSFEGGVNSVVTDTAGVAIAPDFTANSVAGTYTVTASTIGTDAFAVFDLTNSARAVGRITAVGGTPQTTRVGTVFPARFAASVQDSFGNPVNGVEVTFAAPATGARGTFPGGELSATVTTDSAGMALAPAFTAGSSVGTYSVAVTATGVPSSAMFALTNAAGYAASISAAMGGQQATEVKTAFSIPLSAQVRDASGNVVGGVLVTFLAPGEGPSGEFPWGVTINVATDTNGVATAPLFIANQISGSYAVIARVEGVEVPAAFELINIPGTVNALSIDAEDGGPIPTQTTQSPFAIRIIARDRFGNIAKAFTGNVDLSSSGVLSLGAGLTPPFAEGVLTRHSVAVRNAGRFVLVAIRTGGAETGKSDTFQVINPAPSVTRLSPSGGARGESLNLTVSGSGFLQGVTSVILGNNITTYETVASDSQITVALNIGSDALEGPRSVFVINPPPGGGIVSVDSGFVVKGIIYPETYDLVHTVMFPAYSQKSDYRDTDYRIIGFPGAAEAPISQILSGSSNQDWAAYWDNGDSTDYLIPYDGSNTFSLSPGRAFWLLRSGPLVINTEVPTVPLDSTTSVSIALHPGWNLISNPFTVPVAWSDIQAANQPGVLGGVYGFDGSFTLSTVLEPFEGSLFDNAGNLPSLVIPFKQARLFNQKPPDEGGWKVEVDLRSGDYHERLVTFGVVPGAGNGRDQYDLRRPRGVGSHPEAYFEHPEWGAGLIAFATDIRGVVAGLESWPMRVRALPRQPVQLSFVGVSAVPEPLRVVLLDDDRARSVDLRSTPSYVFVPTTTVSHFRIAVGGDKAISGLLDEVLPKKFALENNFPNPFNPSTKIPVTVPWKSSVVLRVYTVLGELVRTLYTGSLEAGRHTFEWDGTTDQGLAASAGVYLIQMSAEGGQQFVGKMLLIK